MGFIGSLYRGYIGKMEFRAPFLGLLHPIRENQLENKMEDEMETRKYVGVISGVYESNGKANLNHFLWFRGLEV